ncbi:MAG: DNA mismatch repair protein MutS [Caulobacteraceae bacterium]|nr:MAG: DNA mismatch repair protein MutS [Caulobacteraceae bacterium]
MKRPPRPEEIALWARVAETVKPLPGRKVPKAAAAKPEAPSALPPKLEARAALAKALKVTKPKPPPEPLEPNRSRRVVKEREVITGRVDLHGLTLERARPVLERYILSAVERGDRLVLVITGKGSGGRETLRGMTPLWLSQPPLRGFVAGVQQADRRHGGEGAFYVALKKGR